MYIEEYSGNNPRRGKNRNITFKNIRVTAPRMPESHFRGYDADSGCENITVNGLWLNGQRITDEKDAGLRFNDFCKNIRFL